MFMVNEMMKLYFMGERERVLESLAHGLKRMLTIKQGEAHLKILVDDGNLKRFSKEGNHNLKHGKPIREEDLARIGAIKYETGLVRDLTRWGMCFNYIDDYTLSLINLQTGDVVDLRRALKKDKDPITAGLEAFVNNSRYISEIEKYPYMVIIK